MSYFTNTPRSGNIGMSGTTSFFQSKNDLQLTAETFEKWRQYIYDSCGIFFQDNKKYLLESRLLKRINHLKLSSFEEYLDFVKFNVNRNSEKKYLYDAITINETFFFRNQPQLDALAMKVVPEIIAQKRKLGKNKIRIWSAASSSGEEAYSTAITMVEFIKPKFPGFDFEIVGTDISPDVVARARSGIYKEYAVRNTPAFYMKKYFTFDGSNYILDPKIRNMVTFKELNLYDDFGMKGMMNFDIIFCANVLIYFDVKSKIRVVNHLYNSLNRGGYLYIGYSETLHGISKAFKIVSFPKTIGYKKE